MRETLIRHEAQVDARIAAAGIAEARAASRVESYEKAQARYGRYETELAEARVTLAAATAEHQAASREYGGWSRFFMVPGGHIHSSMSCSTCNNGAQATQFGWLTDLSGLTEKDAVDAHGALLCTVCFPSAPVEWTNYYEAKAAEKAASECPGSRRYYDASLPHRKGYYTGNWASCPECGARVTLTKTLMLRAHKPGGAK